MLHVFRNAYLIFATLLYNQRFQALIHGAPQFCEQFHVFVSHSSFSANPVVWEVACMPSCIFFYRTFIWNGILTIFSFMVGWFHTWTWHGTYLLEKTILNLTQSSRKFRKSTPYSTMLQTVLKSKVTIPELYMNWKMSSAAKVLHHRCNGTMK